MPPFNYKVTVTRLGVLIATLRGAVDYGESRILFGPGVDVKAGDVVTFSGRTRRVNAATLPYSFSMREAGTVAYYDPDPPYLPDWGFLRRPDGVPVVNEATGVLTAPQGAPVWDGPCKVVAGIGEGVNPEDMATQRITEINHVVSVPLELTDVNPADLLRITQTRDPRLLGRDLVVVGIRLTSEDLVRQLLVRDPQG